MRDGRLLGVAIVALAPAAAFHPSSGFARVPLPIGPGVVADVVAAVGLGLALLALLRRRSSGTGGRGKDGSRRRLRAVLEPGGSYAIISRDPSRAYGLFAAYVNGGSRGLVLSRLYPAEVRARHPIGPAAVLWLSAGLGPSAVNPTNLVRVVEEIERHIAGLEASIVLLDGLDYLVAQNGAPSVAKFLERLTDAISAHLSRLLVPVDPSRTREQELPSLTRDLRTL